MSSAIGVLNIMVKGELKDRAEAQSEVNKEVARKVVQQSAAYLLIGLYSIDSSVGAHYSIRAATKLSPTVYGLMLGFIMDMRRTVGWQ